MYRPSIIPKNLTNNQPITTLVLISLLVIVPLSFGMTSTVFDIANSTSAQANLSDQSDQYNSEMNKITNLDFGSSLEINEELQSSIDATMSGFNIGFRENPNLARESQYLLSSSQLDMQFSQSSVQLRIPNYDSFIETNEMVPSDQGINVDQNANPLDYPLEIGLIDHIGQPMALKPLEYTITTLEFVGSNPVQPMAENPSTSYFNYFFGSDPDKWISNAPSYNKIVYKNLYDNIDLVYTLKEGQLKYDFYVYPRGNYEEIQLRWDGPISLQQSNEGLQINISTPFGEQSFVDSNPINFVGSNREENLLGSFRVINERTYGFSIDVYDRSEVLIIDPVLKFSTFIGGSGEDVGDSLAIDGNGDIYITGSTGSTDFPTTLGAYDKTHNGGTYDVFVSKLSADGSTLIFSTFFGGSDEDVGDSLAVDGNGDIYITGSTGSTDFPTTLGAYDKTHNGGTYDVFVSKLSVDGSTLLFSTFLGGSGNDVARSLAVDTTDNVYITGFSRDSTVDFPTTLGAYDETHNGYSDVFVSKLAANGSTLLFSTFIGASGDDVGNSMVVDDNGDVYFIGDTTSNGFPTTLGAYDEIFNAGSDGFVSKLAANGSTLLFSSFIGGSGDDYSTSFGIDGNRDIYITGFTVSTDFPTTTGTYDRTPNGNDDVFVSKLSADGSALLFSTFLGGSNIDRSQSLAVDGNGDVYLTGFTTSSDFPTTTGAYDETKTGVAFDMFIVKLAADGSTPIYSTFFGHLGNDFGLSIAVDDDSYIYVIGKNDGTNFPTTPGAYDETYNGGMLDVIVIKLRLNPDPPSTLQSMTNSNGEGSIIFLIWGEPDEGASSITSFNVYRGTSSGSYSYLGSTSGSQYYYSDSSVIENQAYYYVVTAINKYGESVFSLEHSAITPPTEVITETETSVITETETSIITETETSIITETETNVSIQTTTGKTFFPILPVVMFILILPNIRRRLRNN